MKSNLREEDGDSNYAIIDLKLLTLIPFIC